jgi:RNA polymerase sigma-70 factor (ECF subfamily)
MQPRSPDVTALLTELTKGNPDAASELIPIVYDELRRLAGRYMRRERTDHTLQATALVHEAYIKLVQQQAANWQSRAHFFGIAAQVMRHILVDHARGLTSEKRGGGKRPAPLEEALVFTPEKSLELLKLDESLQRLTELDPRQARVVELRFFGGLTVEEAADVLSVSPKTVKREWSMAKAWLHGDMRRRHGDPPGQPGGDQGVV